MMFVRFRFTQDFSFFYFYYQFPFFMKYKSFSIPLFETFDFRRIGKTNAFPCCFRFVDGRNVPLYGLLILPDRYFHEEKKKRIHFRANGQFLFFFFFFSVDCFKGIGCFFTLHTNERRISKDSPPIRSTSEFLRRDFFPIVIFPKI